MAIKAGITATQNTKRKLLLLNLIKGNGGERPHDEPARVECESQAESGSPDGHSVTSPISYIATSCVIATGT